MLDATTSLRDAATVVLVRDAVPGPEVFLVRRHRRSGFAADAWVFPGGTVDAADRTVPSERWTGIDPDSLAGRFCAAAELVLGFHVAAVRETFEEAGILLASAPDDGPVDVALPEVEQMRRRLADRRARAGEFARWVAQQRLVLQLGELAYLSRWITPDIEPRRYDTAFFVARAPRQQVAQHDRVETTAGRWTTARAALDAHEAGELHLIYPTVRTLERLAPHRTVDELLADAHSQQRVPTVLPHFEELPDGTRRVLHPDHDGYPLERYRDELAGRDLGA